MLPDFDDIGEFSCCLFFFYLAKCTAVNPVRIFKVISSMVRLCHELCLGHELGLYIPYEVMGHRIANSTGMLYCQNKSNFEISVSVYMLVSFTFGISLALIYILILINLI